MYQTALVITEIISYVSVIVNTTVCTSSLTKMRFYLLFYEKLKKYPSTLLFLDYDVKL